MLSLQTLPTKLSRDGVSDSLQRDTTDSGENNSLEKVSMAKNSRGANFPPSNYPPPLPETIFPSLNASDYRSRRKNHVKKRNKEKRRLGVWCKFVFYLGFCLYINVHFLIYLYTFCQYLNRQISLCISFDVHFVNLLIVKSHFFYLLMYIFELPSLCNKDIKCRVNQRQAIP